MNVKTGIDIIEVKRIKQSIEKYTDSFLNRVFTNSEIEYCEARKTQKFQSYAGRFAAKEAIFKAVSEKLENKFSIEWKDIEIINDENGRPFVNFYGKLKEIIGDNYEIDVSISHIGEYAVASVVFLIGFLIGDGENFFNRGRRKFLKFKIRDRYEGIFDFSWRIFDRNLWFSGYWSKIWLCKKMIIILKVL